MAKLRETCNRLQHHREKGKGRAFTSYRLKGSSLWASYHKTYDPRRFAGLRVSFEKLGRAVEEVGRRGEGRKLGEIEIMVKCEGKSFCL